MSSVAGEEFHIRSPVGWVEPLNTPSPFLPAVSCIRGIGIRTTTMYCKARDKAFYCNSVWTKLLIDMALKTHWVPDSDVIRKYITKYLLRFNRVVVLETCHQNLTARLVIKKVNANWGAGSRLLCFPRRMAVTHTLAKPLIINRNIM